jgi:hypothetical protein
LHLKRGPPRIATAAQPSLPKMLLIVESLPSAAGLASSTEGGTP